MSVEARAGTTSPARSHAAEPLSGPPASARVPPSPKRDLLDVILGASAGNGGGGGDAPIRWNRCGPSPDKPPPIPRRGGNFCFSLAMPFLASILCSRDR